MRLYKITSYEPSEGRVFVWAGTQAEAKVAAKKQKDNLTAAYGNTDEKPEVTEIDLPTDKAGLLAWLNTNFNRDNG